MFRSVFPGAAWLLVAASAWAADGAAPDNARAMLLAGVGRACLAAKTPADLETLAVKLDRLPASGDPASMQRQRGAVLLVSKWRDYLTAVRAEDNDAAVKALDGLIESTEWVSLMPRSPVLERYAEATKVRWVNYSLKSLEDVDTAIRRLRDFDAKYGLWRDGRAALKEFERLQEIRRQVGQVPAATVEAACRPRADEDPEVSTYKMLLLPLVVASYLDLPEDFRLPPQKGEMTFDYLQRILELAEKKGELVVYWRVLAYRAGLLGDCPAWTTSRLTALDKTLSGLKKEGESQTGAALGDYLEALTKAGIPPQVIVCGEHARQIIETNPEVVQQLAATRQQEMVRARLGMGNRPGMPQDMPGFPGAPAATPGIGTPRYPGERDYDLWRRY
jgi:hypothetical protein